MTVKELREILATLRDETEIVIGGEEGYYELGAMDWADEGPIVYLLTGDVAEGYHILPSLEKDKSSRGVGNQRKHGEG